LVLDSSDFIALSSNVFILYPEKSKLFGVDGLWATWGFVISSSEEDSPKEGKLKLSVRFLPILLFLSLIVFLTRSLALNLEDS
jgi:hypothetical protein